MILSSRLLENYPPLFVRIAPNLTDEELEDIANAIIEDGIDDILISNTSNQRPNSLVSKHVNETCGLSGLSICDMPVHRMWTQ